MGNPHLQRAWLLFEQSRHEMAEQELRQTLAQDPHEPTAHSLLALCLSQRKDYQEATREAQQGVHMAPDVPFSHYALATVLFDRNRYPEAEAALAEAIALEPQAGHHLSLLSAIKFQLRDWTAALDAAERGLAVDPEDVQCANLRAMALNKLRRSGGASATLEAALAKAPDNATSHANLGWTRLQQGRTKESLEHFREALRLDPESDWARAGVVEALKSRNFLYRWLLAYFLWISGLSRGAQWGVILGAYVGYRALGGIARSSPELAIWIWPLLMLYIAFALLTWLGTPVFNLMLRLNRYGRLVLSRDQTVASNWVGLSMLLAAGLFVAGLALANPQLLLAALIAGLLVLPISGTFLIDPGWPRHAMGWYTGGLILCGAGAAAAPWLHNLLGYRADPLSSMLLMLFILGIFASQFLVNALATATPKH